MMEGIIAVAFDIIRNGQYPFCWYFRLPVSVLWVGSSSFNYPSHAAKAGLMVTNISVI
jgi:hypothetical protein